MKDVKTRWAVYDNGLKIWYDGELLAVIDPSEFKYLIKDLAEHQAWQDKNDNKDAVPPLPTQD